MENDDEQNGTSEPRTDNARSGIVTEDAVGDADAVNANRNRPGEMWGEICTVNVSWKPAACRIESFARVCADIGAGCAGNQHGRTSVDPPGGHRLCVVVRRGAVGIRFEGIFV